MSLFRLLMSLHFIETENFQLIFDNIRSNWNVATSNRFDYKFIVQVVKATRIMNTEAK